MLTFLLTAKSYAYNYMPVSPIDETRLNIVQGKIYFYADEIVVSEAGLYVLVPNVNGETISYSIPNLQYDSSGIFI